VVAVRIPAQLIGRGSADDRVDIYTDVVRLTDLTVVRSSVDRCDDLVGARRVAHGVCPVLTDKGVGSIRILTLEERVSARSAVLSVVPETSGQSIVAGFTIERVCRFVADQRV
jgi:hypothetical protein